MIINPYLVAPSVTYDPDAQAFITASGISGSNATSINNLVINLKAAGIWTKMKAIYPFIGGTSFTHKWNLKDPQDTNAAYRLSFIGGWTHSSNGILPNGTNAYADTFLNPSTQLTNNNTHISFYSRTDTDGIFFDMGSGQATGQYFDLALRLSGNIYTDQYNNSTGRITTVNPNSLGFYISSRTASNVFKLFKNDAQLGTTNTGVSTGFTSITSNMYISALREGVNTLYYSNRQCAFASIGDGLTDLEAQVFNQIVEGYQYSLGRNINPAQSFYYNPAYNNETNTFLYSTQIVDLTTQGAVNTLVNDMKTYGVWSKMKAVYPIVGSTSTTQKFNLVNSQDLNSAFRLSFSGGWTHSSLGIQGNGTNAFANTFLSPNVVLSLNSTHISAYTRSNISINAPLLSSENAATYANGLYIWAKQVVAPNNSSVRVNDNTSDGVAAPADIRGLHIATRTASNVKKYILNNTQQFSVTSASTSLNTSSIYIGSSRNNNNYNTSEIAFASIGDGLTDSDAANFFYSVQKFQTTLGRNIGTNYPTVSDTDAQSFINTANITDLTQANAVNDLVIGLKADGIWTKMKAIYPMVGGSASSHSINLKTQSQFNLSFVGGWTHSSTGATPNGTNAYANTFLTPSTSLSINNTHLSYYSRSNTSDAGQDIGCAILTTEAQYCSLIIKNTNAISANYYIINVAQSNVSSTSAANSDSRGFFLGSRTASNVLTGFKNSTKILNSSTNSTVIPNISIYIGALNYNNSATQFVTKECSFSSIGDGLTDIDASNLYSRVQTFNTTLGRQV